MIEVAAGAYHSLALTEDGSVYAWGRNENGELGNGTYTNSSIPVKVEGLSDIKTIAAGYYSNFAVKEDGSVYAWGVNGAGQLGIGINVCLKTNIPVEVPVEKVSSIAAGMYHTAALTEDGDVITWGYNDMRQLGDDKDNYTIGKLETISGMTALAAGENICFALGNNGIVTAWGENSDGQFVDKNIGEAYYPQEITDISGAKSISAGYGHVLVLKDDGTVVSWGNDGSGQLGRGLRIALTIPQLLSNSIFDNNRDQDNSIAVFYGPTRNIIEYSGDVDWFKFTVPYDALYRIDITEGFEMECHMTGGQLADITERELKRGETVYIRVTASDDCTGEYELSISSTIKDMKKEQCVTVGDHEYYINVYDGRKLYMDDSPMTSYSVRYLCVYGDNVYLSSANYISKVSETGVKNIEAVYPYVNFIAVDEKNIYYSDWFFGGIYAINLSNHRENKICGDIGTRLYVDGEYLYYYNVRENGELYRIKKEGSYVENGEKV